MRDPGREDRFIDAGQDRGRGPLQRTRGLQPPAGLLGAGDQLGHHRSRGRHRRIVEFPTDHPGPEPIQPASGHLRDQVRGARQQRQCLPETVTSGLHRDPQTRRHQLRSIHRLIPDPVVDLLEGAVLTLGDFDRRELAQRLDLAGVDHIAQLLQPRQTGRQPRQTPLPREPDRTAYASCRPVRTVVSSMTTSYRTHVRIARVCTPVFRTNSIVLQLFYSYHEPRTTALTAAVKRRLQPSSTLGQAPGRGPRAAGQRVCLAGGVSAAGHGFRVPSFRGGMAGRGGGRPGACAPCGADLKRNGTTTAGRT